MWIRSCAAAAAAWSLGLALACAGPAEPRLLLLVTVDTLRADELGAYGSPRGLTPQLDSLAVESAVFESAYAAAPLTLPSLAALLTGRYPEELGMRNNESAVPESTATLATDLGERGWRTGAVVGNFVLRRSSGLARGFDLYDDEFPQREAVRSWPERIASDTTQAALDMLDECAGVAGARCFLWVHYQDPHGPYDPPPGRRARLLSQERGEPDGARQLPRGQDHSGLGAIPDYQFLDGRHDLAFYRAGYRAEIQYMDEQVGRLLARVRELELADGAVVVFAADHGESLGEGDVWFAHGSRLGDDQVRVPLMLRVPGRRPERRSEPVSLADLRSTLLTLVAAGDHPAPGGRDLLASGPAPAPSPPYMATLGASPVQHFAIVEDGYKFVVSEREGVFDGRLYRLGREEVDLTAAAPQLAARLRGKLAELRRRVDRGRAETRQGLSPEDREALGQLGYLDPEPAREP